MKKTISMAELCSVSHDKRTDEVFATFKVPSFILVNAIKAEPFQYASPVKAASSLTLSG